METKGFFYSIFINVLISHFRLVPILWDYGHYKLFSFFSAEIVFRRQNLKTNGEVCSSIVNKWEYIKETKLLINLASSPYKQINEVSVYNLVKVKSRKYNLTIFTTNKLCKK